MAGHPDDQAYAMWQGPVLVAGLPANLAPGLQTIYSGPAPPFAAIRARIDPTGGFGTVNFNWFADAAFTQGVGIDPWVLPTGTGISVIIPVQAPFLTITINVTSTGFFVATIYITGLNVGSGKITYPVAQLDVETGNQTCPISGTQLFPVRFIRGGLALYSFAPFDATGKLRARIAHLNADGTTGNSIAELPNTTVLTSALVGIPDAPVAIWITNTDAAATHQYSATLTGGAD